MSKFNTKVLFMDLFVHRRRIAIFFRLNHIIIKYYIPRGGGSLKLLGDNFLCFLSHKVFSSVSFCRIISSFRYCFILLTPTSMIHIHKSTLNDFTIIIKYCYKYFKLFLFVPTNLNYPPKYILLHTQVENMAGSRKQILFQENRIGKLKKICNRIKILEGIHETSIRC
jgi:hypothetical protein